MRNTHSTTRQFQVVITFPSWCDAEGEYVNQFASEIEASEAASDARRKYPPCSVQVFKVDICDMFGTIFEGDRKLIGSLSSKANWWRN